MAPFDPNYIPPAPPVTPAPPPPDGPSYSPQAADADAMARFDAANAARARIESAYSTIPGVNGNTLFPARKRQGLEEMFPGMPKPERLPVDTGDSSRGNEQAPQQSGLDGLFKSFGIDPLNPSASLGKMVSVSSSGHGSKNWTQHDKNYLPSMRNAMAKEASAAATEESALLKQNAAEQAAYQNNLTQKALLEGSLKKDREGILRSVKEHEQHISDTLAEVSRAKPNTDRWWSSKNVGQQIGFFISAALSGFGQGMTGGRGTNSIVSFVQNQIDRDIDLQKYAIDNKKWAAGQERGIVSSLYERLGDLDKSAAMARIAMNEAFGTQLKLVATSNAPDQIRARAMMADAARMKTLAQLTDEAVKVSRSSGGGSEKRSLLSLLPQMAGVMAAANKASKSGAEGAMGKMPVEMQSKYDGAKQFIPLLDNLRKSYEKNAPVNAPVIGRMFGSHNQVYDADLKRTLNALILANSGKVAAKDEVARNLDTLAGGLGPREWNKQIAREKMNGHERDILTKLAGWARSYPSVESDLRTRNSQIWKRVEPYFNEMK